MNNPTFSPSASPNTSRRSSTVSMSNEEMAAYSNIPSTMTNDGYVRRTSFGPTPVRKGRKNRKSRNRKNRKSRKGRRN
jgi:hypothetical protein